MLALASTARAVALLAVCPMPADRHDQLGFVAECQVMRGARRQVEVAVEMDDPFGMFEVAGTATVALIRVLMLEARAAQGLESSATWPKSSIAL